MESEQKESLIRIILGTVLGVAAIIVSHLFSLPVWALVLIYLPGYLVAGSGVLLGAAGSIIHGELFDERFLMSAATIGAFFIGEYPEAVFVMILYLIGEMLGDTAVDRTRDSVGALAELIPDSVTVIRDGTEISVPPESVNPGELLVVRPGEWIALDGTAEEGSSSLDLSALTGESLPRDIAPGDSVFSGAINLSGVLKIRTSGRVSESTVSRILEMVEESSEHKSKSEGFVRRFSRIYTPCVVAAAVILGVVPPIFDGRWAVWIERALSFLVVSCPCAVVISVPLSFFCGIGNASRKGILFKGSVSLETLSKANTAVFDKTGTLTDSGFVIEEVIPETEDVSPEGLIGIAAYLESYSTHPLAAPVIEKYGREIDKSRVTGVSEGRSSSGRGITAEIDGKRFYAGNAAYIRSFGIDCPAGSGKTEICVSDIGRLLGRIFLSDQLKPDAVTAVTRLRSRGLSVAMLSGDGEAAVASAAEKLGLENGEYASGLFPADKTAYIEKLRAEGKKSVFVGDGINDAPVLSAADAGVSMGGLGSRAAVEASDIVLIEDKPSAVATAYDISRKTMSIVKINIIFALAAKLAILILNLTGLGNMWLSAAGDVGVMLVCVLNSLRALK